MKKITDPLKNSQCPHCGHPLPAPAPVCPACNTPLTPPPSADTPPIPAPPNIGSHSKTSLILGIISLCCFGVIFLTVLGISGTIIPCYAVIGLPAGIVGLYFGIKGVIAIWRNRQLQGKGRSIAGFIISLVVTFVWLWSFIAPQVAMSIELRNQLQCGTNLSAVGKAMMLYRDKYPDSWPADLSVLVREADLDPKCLLCPSTDDKLGSCSYIYRGADLSGRTNPELVLAYDKSKNHEWYVRNILFADGHVTKYSEEFEKIIAKDNQIRRASALPEKPPAPEPPPQIHEKNN
jgi:prepilin-type processing-associated H-X9-DG protein